MNQILAKLKEDYGLDDRHIAVIDALTIHGKMDAKKICDVTSITPGRIYNYLNFLIGNKLIIRTGKRPFEYEATEINEHILEFTKNKIDALLESQYQLVELMGKNVTEHFDRITSSIKFTQTHLSMISETKKAIKYISLHTAFPYVLYPFDKDAFIKLRKAVVQSRPTITSYDPMMTLLVRKTYLDALDAGKEMIVIFEKMSWEYHLKVIKSFGRTFFNFWKKSLLKQFADYKIKAYFIDEYLPMQIDINERRVNLSFRHYDIINGIVISGRDITDLYNQVFDQHLSRSKDILPILSRVKY